ncbi:MAG: hypothetical protein Salg2KO_03770 [Salibacteraceae bacterium]
MLLPIISSAQANDKDSIKKDTIMHSMPYQITFVPPMSTNGFMASKTTHTVSLNIVAGYNGGVNGIEAAGFANVLVNDMKGTQAAGFANVVRGNMKGAQAAGFSNYVHGSSEGIMLAGFTNHSNHGARAVQAAGFSNQALGSVKGSQLAGFANMCKDSLSGLQASGFANYAGSHTSGGQAAGFANVAKGDLQGVQAAGFANTAVGEVDGAQIAGFANAAFNVNGGQASGFLNMADTVRGVQISFINVADTFAKGAPIGFLSYVHKGYRNYSIGVNELGWVEGQFRTGVSRLHNVFAASLNPIPSMSSWAYGVGLGSKIIDQSKSDVVLDLMAFHVNERELYTNSFNMLYRLSARYEYHPKAERFAFWASPSLNVQQSSYDRFDGSNFKSKLAPYTIFDDKGTYLRSKFWVGLQAGVSF